MSACSLVHAFCRYTLGYCNLANSCNESSESVHLNQNICLSSLEQVCPLLPSIPTQMAPFHHYCDTTSQPRRNLALSLHEMKFTGGGGWWESFRCDEHFSSCNFLAEHIISDRCHGGSVVQWLGHRTPTHDQKIASSTPGRCIAG